MSLAPRAVIVHRRTELDELLARHGTRGQAAFFLSTRGRQIEEVEARHEAQQTALASTNAAVPIDWRRGTVERADLSRFLFAPDDVIVAVGQDGLVANVAKYLDGQPVIGINPDPARNPGILVPHPSSAVSTLVAAAVGNGSPRSIEMLTMVEARVDDGQKLLALNEVFVGHPSHQSARYTLLLPDGSAEAQSSSGVIASTGTGATGWCRSAWLERHSCLDLPAPTARSLARFVREAWPSPATGASLTEGSLDMDAKLSLTVKSDHLVVFGDGIESDSVSLGWGQTIEVRVASRTLHLVR